MASHLAVSPSEDQVVCSKDNRNISPCRKHHKTKQKRKVLMSRNDKTNNRTIKNEPSSARTTQETSEAQEFTASCNLELVESDHSSRLKMLQTKLDDTEGTITSDLMQMTFEERDITLSEKRKEGATGQEDEKTNDGINNAHEATEKELPTLLKEPERINVDLEKKIALEYVSTGGSSIDLSSMNVIDNDMPLIIQRIFRKGTNQCTQLVLRDNALTSDGVKILVDELLLAPTSLKNLTLSSNVGIGDVGVEHLARLLKTNRSITLLALHHTGITDEGARLLANALCDTEGKSSSPIEKLYISFNKSITDDSLETLARILEQNQTLKLLSLEHCSLSDKARRRLRQLTAKKKKRKFCLLE